MYYIIFILVFLVSCGTKELAKTGPLPEPTPNTEQKDPIYSYKVTNCFKYGSTGKETKEVWDCKEAVIYIDYKDKVSHIEPYQPYIIEIINDVYYLKPAPPKNI